MLLHLLGLTRYGDHADVAILHRLVATLGAKSALKKVSRKAILDVDVSKTCETIGTPDAPLALRLQSNLL